MSATPALRLVREAKVADLLASVAGGAHRFEASGVLAQGGWFWVIFDNVGHIGRIDPALEPDGGTALLHRPAGPVGCEDIAHDPDTGRYFLVVEAVKHGSGYRAQVHEFDADFRPLRARLLDFPLDRPNKGIEGLTCVRRGGETYLLGLCEGNRCAGGDEGRRPGGGRVHVFAEGGRHRWDRVHTIHLPAVLPFVDYSSISVAGDRIAVLSQESSALWVGRLNPSTWDVAGAGEVHRFPCDGRGRTLYGTVEGVSWIGAGEVVVVSDRAKPDQPGRYRRTDESIHVFALDGAW
jgi:hypothetical protein